MRVSLIALTASLAFGTASVAAHAQGYGQSQSQQQPQGNQQQQQQAQQQGDRQFEFSREERTAIAPLYQAIESQDWAAAQAALPAAEAAAQGADAKFIVAQAKLRIGVQAQNPQMQAEAIDTMIASGAAQPRELRPLLTNQAALAISAGNLEKAEAAFTRLVQLNPNDPEAVVRLAEVKNDRGNKAEAVPLYQRALQLREASGERAPENWYRRALAVAYEARLAQPAVELTKELVSAYPSQVNWRDALLIYREISNPDGALNIDTMRLMRAADALTGERDYIEFAEALSQAGLPGEAKAVLEHGVSRGMLEANDAQVRELLTLAEGRIREDRASLQELRGQAEAAAQGRQARAIGDAYFGYGEFDTAIQLYQLALQKGGVDNDLVNTRLGMALALSGQQAEAEAAFRAVGGQRQQLADYWLTWLAQRAG